MKQSFLYLGRSLCDDQTGGRCPSFSLFLFTSQMSVHCKEETNPLLSAAQHDAKFALWDWSLNVPILSNYENVPFFNLQTQEVRCTQILWGSESQTLRTYCTANDVGETITVKTTAAHQPINSLFSLFLQCFLVILVTEPVVPLSILGHLTVLWRSSCTPYTSC